MMQYDSQYPLYGLAFSHVQQHPHRTALTTLLSGPNNKLMVVEPDERTGTFQQLASTNLGFPATKVGWDPSNRDLGGYDSAEQVELLATTGDVLRIWDLSKDWEGSAGNGSGGYVGRNGWSNEYVLNARSVLTNSKSPQMSLPPITSFSWNPMRTESIVTCSIDTTATLWDINTAQALTQLIAHDRAVYDLAWLPQSPDIFVSVGADGSLRAFDLRQLEHSTILYESAGDTPLARIAFSNTEQHMLACFGLEDRKTLILDMRSPGQPVAELVGHRAPLSAIAWGSGGDRGGDSSGGWIASGGDDGQVLIYDLTGELPKGQSSSSKAPRNRDNNSSQQPSASDSKNSYALSPSVGTAATNRTPSPSPAVDVVPAKAFAADTEINNLTFTDDGAFIGFVAGQRLNLLQV